MNYLNHWYKVSSFLDLKDDKTLSTNNLKDQVHIFKRRKIYLQNKDKHKLME